LVPDKQNILPEYLWLNLRSRYNEIRSKENIGGGVPHLNGNIVAKLLIPVPSLQEQQNIVETIRVHHAVLAQVRFQVKAASNRLDELIERVLMRENNVA
jgi:hypothetical protein